jgi:hypothetical protein
MPITDSLLADESIVFQSHKHWMAPIRASLWAAAMILGAAVLRLLSQDGDGFFSFVWGIMDLISIALVVGGIGWIVYNIIAWRTAQFVVTNTRILHEEGLASRRSSTTLLTSLSDVKTNVGFVGGRLGYGDVTLLTQSGSAGEDRFLAITEPMKFRDAVMTQKMAAGGGSGRPAAAPVAAAPVAAAPVAAAPTSADAAAALASLADLHDRGAITDAEFEAKKADLLARM